MSVKSDLQTLSKLIVQILNQNNLNSLSQSSSVSQDYHDIMSNPLKKSILKQFLINNPQALVDILTKMNLPSTELIKLKKLFDEFPQKNIVIIDTFDSKVQQKKELTQINLIQKKLNLIERQAQKLMQNHL